MLKKIMSLTPSQQSFLQLNSIENYSPLTLTSTQSISVQTDYIKNTSKYTNTPNYFDNILMQGKDMNDNEFENFIKGK